MRFLSMIGHIGTSPMAGEYSRNNPKYFRYNAFIHAPQLSKYNVAYSCTLEEDENASGTVSFSVARNHPDTAFIKTGMIVEVLESETEPKGEDSYTFWSSCGQTKWVGRIISMSIDIYGNKTCTCEGPLGFLKDIWFVTGQEIYSTPTLRDWINYVLGNPLHTVGALSVDPYTDTFNGMTEMADGRVYYAYPERLRIIDAVLGHVNQHDPNGYEPNILSTRLSMMGTDLFETVLTAYQSGEIFTGGAMNLFDILSNIFNGFGQPEAEGYPYDDQYVYIRMEVIPDADTAGMVPYSLKMRGFRLVLDLDSPSRNGYPSGNNRLYFGESVIAGSIDYDFSKTYTAIRAVGAEIEPETPEYGLPTDWKRAVTVSADNNEHGAIVHNGVLDSDNGAIEEFGIVPGVIQYSDIKNSANLNLHANIYRNLAANPISKFTVTGVDLSLVKEYLSEIELGKYYDVRFPGQDMDNNVIGEKNYLYRCIGRKKDLLNPSRNEYKFSRIIGVLQNRMSTIGSNAQARAIRKIQTENRRKISELESVIAKTTAELEKSSRSIEELKTEIAKAKTEENKTLKEEEIQNGEINGISGDHSVTAE